MADTKHEKAPWALVNSHELQCSFPEDGAVPPTVATDACRRIFLLLRRGTVCSFLSWMFLMLVSLNSAYAATWTAAFDKHKLRYNQRVWTLIGEHHDADDTFVGFSDKTDGTSIYLRIESLANLVDVDDAAIEQSLAESLAAEKFQTVRLERGALPIAGKTFQRVKYQIKNSKFGEQFVIHGYHRQQQQVVILMLAWPRQLPLSNSGLPLKLEALLAGITWGDTP